MIVTFFVSVWFVSDFVPSSKLIANMMLFRLSALRCHYDVLLNFPGYIQSFLWRVKSRRHFGVVKKCRVFQLPFYSASAALLGVNMQKKRRYEKIEPSRDIRYGKIFKDFGKF